MIYNISELCSFKDTISFIFTSTFKENERKMITLTPVLSETSTMPLYLQLYRHIRSAILAGEIRAGERLPSLRSLSKSLKLSITTVEQAYNQLAVEGYIQSRPQSGYYTCDIAAGDVFQQDIPADRISEQPSEAPSTQEWEIPDYNGLSGLDHSLLSAYYDPACFDFVKWKKCMNRILTEYTDFLYSEGDPRGEAPLRHEISRYIYQARGVRCQPEQIVIGAGTQQLTGLLCIILANMGIDYVAFEEPGYLPVRSIFRDRGFKMTTVPVQKDGIQIQKLPANIRSTAYVSPSNQFPTGSVMPVARCYQLLEWAEKNDSIIIEDDYNSELRYFGRAVPSLQGLDRNQRVVYLGSFSSTLFPAIKISYMVLPRPMLRIFEEHLASYTQTCSKTEQLTLALYMEKGLYQANIKKLRNLYAQKIQVATAALQRFCGDAIVVRSNTSGLHMLLELPGCNEQQLADIYRQGTAEGLPLLAVSPSGEASGPQAQRLLIFYYTRIPMDRMEEAVQRFSRLLPAASADISR